MKKGFTYSIIALLAAIAAAFAIIHFTNNANNIKKIESLNADLSEKTNQINTLNADAADKASQIETLNADVADKVNQIETLNADVAEKASQIEILNADVADKAKQIETLNADAADKANQIETLKTDAADKASQIETLNADVADKAKQIETLNADAADKAKQIESLKADVAAKDKELETLNALVISFQKPRIKDLVSIHANIIRELSASLTAANLKVTVDPNNGDIVLGNSIFFEKGKASIKEEGQELLNRFIPVYLDVLLRDKYADYLGEITIEGHTDSSGTYESDLKLSQDRALQVALYCLNMPSLSHLQKAKLRQILTAKGRSCSDLVYDANGMEDSDASRRVEFKFRLKDAEMIAELNRLLSE